MAINSSLMTLGRCLEVLRWNQQQQQQQQQHKAGPGTGLLPPPQLRVVPYRESRVTHLFRDALHGWGQVVLSVNVSPAARDYDETAHVLKVGVGRRVGGQVGAVDSSGAVWITSAPPLTACLPFSRPPPTLPHSRPYAVRRASHPDRHDPAGRGAATHPAGRVAGHQESQAQGSAAARGTRCCRWRGRRRWRQVSECS